MKFGVVVAARAGSTRLPGKALLPLGGKPMILFLLERLRPSRLAERLILATTTLPGDDRLAETARSAGFEVFRGEPEDVVARYAACAQAYDLEYVVRVTADCPLLDAESLDWCLEQCREFGRFDLASTKRAFPVGLDYEIFRAESLRRIHEREPLSAEDREHLTLYFYKRGERFDVRRLQPPAHWPRTGRTFTVDTAEDYAACVALVEGLEPGDRSALACLRRAVA